MSDVIRTSFEASEIVEILVHAGASCADDFLNVLETDELIILANSLSIDFEGVSQENLENEVATKMIELRKELE